MVPIPVTSLDRPDEKTQIWVDDDRIIVHSASEACRKLGRFAGSPKPATAWCLIQKPNNPAGKDRNKKQMKSLGKAEERFPLNTQ